MSTESELLSVEQELVKSAGLKYLLNTEVGITRKRIGNNWEYFDQNGSVVRNKITLERIKSLVLPPAWEKVWISPYQDSHLQATGIDKKGRKQYKYHPRWSSTRNERKFMLMKEFGLVLPKIRERIQADLRKKTLSKEKVLATAVALLDQTLIRVGNKEYAEDNQSFGLTTLRDRHVKNLGEGVKLEFKGKSHVGHEIIVSDKKLASIIKKCKDIPGFELFQYYDEEGNKQTISSEDVNSYLKEISGIDITAKSFRTWGGSCIAIKALLEFDPAESDKEIKKNLVSAIKKVSGCLGNTPSVCRKFYVHPQILDKYSEKELVSYIKKLEEQGLPKSEWLKKEEIMFLEVLKNLHPTE